MCLILFVNSDSKEAEINKYTPLVEQFESEKITFTYVSANEYPDLQRVQFGNSAAVVYKPKRRTYLPLEL